MGIEVSDNIKKLFNLDKQIIFAAAKSLTQVAKEAQSEVQSAIKSTFTTRGPWYLPSNKFGVRIKTASKTDLTSSVGTNADWLLDHETGGVKTPQASANLAIPEVGAARPTIDAKVPAALKPRRILPNASNLATGKLVRARGRKRVGFKQALFFINEKGTAIFERLEGHRLKLFYILSPKARIKKQSVVIEPTEKTV
ncbi:MAG: hypothetical protein M3362_22345, partial [Acidobacteriota bacterium]|nr:hypothetical protein [Acidobacteriota bacterium]